MGVKKKDTWKMVKYFVNMKGESYDSEDDLNPGFVEEKENWAGMASDKGNFLQNYEDFDGEHSDNVIMN